MKRYLALFILTLLFWLLITLSLSLANILTGVVAAGVTTGLFGRYFVTRVGMFLEPKRYAWLLAYIFVFLWECIKANFDVAYRVLHPAMPIKPGIVKVKLAVKTDLAKTMLANSITMTPGTITVSIDRRGYVSVHAIDDQSAEGVPGDMEKKLRAVFEED